MKVDNCIHFRAKLQRKKINLICIIEILYKRIEIPNI